MRLLGALGILAAGILALGAAGCADRIANAPGHGRGLTLRLRLADSGPGGTADAFARVDGAHVTVSTESAVLLDTVATFAAGGDGRLALAVILPEATASVSVTVVLLAGGKPLFRGSGSAAVERGVAVTVPITLVPVIAGLTGPDSVLLTALGDTLRLRGAVVFASGDSVSGLVVTWAGDGGPVARVTAEGLVTSLAEGQAQATATYDTLRRTTLVRVQAVVSTVVLSADTFSLFVDSARTLTALARDRNGNALQRSIAWQSANPAVATVDAGGVVRGVAPGSTSITGSSGGRSAQALVTVRRLPVAQVRVTPATDTLLVGTTASLAATTLDAAGNVLTGRAIAWSSSDGAIATVDSTGLVWAVAPGRATVSATSEGRSGSALIEVVQPSVAASAPTVSFTAITGIGPFSQTVTISNSGTGTLTGLSASIAYGAGDGWLSASLDRSSAPATLTLSADATALSPASYSATVTVSSTVTGAGVAKIGVSFVVRPVPVATVLVTPSSPTILVGDTVRLSAATLDVAGHVLTGRTVTWSTSDSTGATVGASGLVRGLRSSTVTISATSEGRTGAATVQVVRPLLAITPDSAIYRVFEGSAALAQRVSVSNAGTGRLTGLSASTTYQGTGGWLALALDSTTAPTGLALTATAGALAPGTYTATVTVSSTVPGSGSKQIAVRLVVVQVPVKTVVLTPSSATLLVGDTLRLAATLLDSAGNTLTGRTVTWSTSDSTVAKVSAGGLVSALRVGSASIQAASGSASATASMQVVQPLVALSPDSAVFSQYPGSAPMAQRISVSNAGSGRLTGLSASITYQGTGGWLSVALDSATAPTVLSVAAAAPAALPPGTYSATVAVSSSVPNSGSAQVRVRLVVVQVPVKTIVLTPSSATLLVGDTLRLAATLLDSAGNVLTGRTVTWSTSDSTVAKVGASGLVSALRVGSASIAAASGSASATAPVQVVQPLVAVAPDSAIYQVFEGSAGVAQRVSVSNAGTGRLTGLSTSTTYQGTGGWLALALDSTTAPTGLALTATAGALAPGTYTATVTVSSTVPNSGSVQVRVRLVVVQVPVKTIVLTPSSATLVVTDTLRLAATLLDSAGNTLTGRTVTWSTSDTTVATVSGSGLVSALRVGSASIAAASGSASATAAVQVVQPLVAISPDSAIFSEYPGSAPVTQRISVSNAGTGRLTGLSAAISYQGTGGWLTVALDSTTASTGLSVVAAAPAALAPGTYTATVTVSSSVPGAGSAQVRVRLVVVQVPVKTIQLTPSSATLVVTDTLRFVATLLDSAGNVLTGRTVNWATSNPTVATVSTSGLVSALSVGSAVIAAASGNVSANVSVQVVQPLVAISADSAIFSQYPGTSAPETQRVSVSNAGTGRLTGLSASIAYQGTGGWLSVALDSTTAPTGISVVAAAPAALAPGTYTATVTVSSTLPGAGSKQIAVRLVVVQVPVKVIVLSPSSDTLVVTDTLRFVATLKDSAGNTLTGRTVTWSTSDTAVATVDGTGLVTGVAEGSATISAASGNVSASSAITVVQPLVFVESTDASLTPDPNCDTAFVPTATTLVVNGGSGGDARLTGLSAVPDSSWLHASLDSTTAPATLTITAKGLSCFAMSFGTVTVSSTVPGAGSVTVNVMYGPNMPPGARRPVIRPGPTP